MEQLMKHRSRDTGLQGCVFPRAVDRPAVDGSVGHTVVSSGQLAAGEPADADGSRVLRLVEKVLCYILDRLSSNRPFADRRWD